MNKFEYLLYIKKLDNATNKTATDILSMMIDELIRREHASSYVFKLLCKALNIVPKFHGRFSLHYAFTNGIAYLLKECSTETEILNILEFLPIVEKIVEKSVKITTNTACSMPIKNVCGKRYAYVLLSVEDGNKYLKHIDPKDIFSLGNFEYIIIKATKTSMKKRGHFG